MKIDNSCDSDEKVHCIYIPGSIKHENVVDTLSVLECFASIKHLRTLRWWINSQQ